MFLLRLPYREESLGRAAEQRRSHGARTPLFTSEQSGRQDFYKIQSAAVHKLARLLPRRLGRYPGVKAYRVMMLRPGSSSGRCLCDPEVVVCTGLSFGESQTTRASLSDGLGSILFYFLVPVLRFCTLTFRCRVSRLFLI